MMSSRCSLHPLYEREAADLQEQQEGQDDCGARAHKSVIQTEHVGKGSASIPGLARRSISYDQSSLLPAGVLVPWNGQTLFVNFNIKMPLSWHVLQSVPLLAFR